MISGPFPRILIAAAAVTGVLHGAPAAGQQTGIAGACPSRRISRVIVETGDVFAGEGADPTLIRWAGALANVFHVRTKSSFVREELLFREGDCLDSLRVEESQRLLGRYPFLRRARITVEDDGDKNAVVRVVTRDEWSTRLDVGLVYDGGPKLEDIRATETNFLGHGVRAQIKRTERRERRDEFYSVNMPRFFGRADASAYFGQSRAGNVYGQSIAYPFVGDQGRVSASEGYSRSRDFVTYVGGVGQPYSHVQIPTERDFGELTFARRIGPPGQSTTIGVSLSHERWDVTGQPTFVTNSDFGAGTPAPATLPALIALQVADGAQTLASVHVGTTRFRYVEMEGLDAVRDVLTVDLGYNAGFSLAQGLAVGAPRGVSPITDTYGRVHGSFGRQIASSFVHGSLTSQAGYSSSGWRDVLADAELVGYGRGGWLPNQTIFLRFSAAGGWNMRSPHQLTLGGRDGVRSLRDDEVPGAHRLVVFLEDRVRLDWPSWSILDLGATFFADAGRTWAGDAPFGQNSPWRASAGAGLRFGVPRGTHGVIRPDIVWPLGRGGEPIFRIAYEVNVYGDRFGTPKLGRGVPHLRGWERF